MEWKPIDTAPKDGTVILVKIGGGEVTLARYAQKGRYKWHFIDECGEDFLANDAMDIFTHWMPLPEPPSADGDIASGHG